jgi:superfamily II DNA or RNA helicase
MMDEKRLAQLLRQNEELVKEIEELKEENQKLKQLLTRNQSAAKQENRNTKRQKLIQAKLRERLNIFNELFKGRKDVFAYRWQDKKGQVGYAPSKNKKNNTYLTLTNQVIFEHLSGKKIIGLYPLLLDNTCWFLALDFDKEKWKDDVKRFYNTCKRFNIPVSLERSRSGNGCHVWIFFYEPIPAKLARELGNFLLTNTLKKGKQLKSFDRMFPNQDKLTKGKFGNLIALPLQGEARKNNNSVFVDENFVPYLNQWQYLSTVRKIGETEIQMLLPSSAKKEILVKEVARYSAPNKLNITYANGIFINKNEIPLDLYNEIAQLARFSNPAYYRAKKNRLSTKDIPRVIDCSEEFGSGLILPRGCLKGLEDLLERKSIDYKIHNQTFSEKDIDVYFTGELTVHQKAALNAMLENPTGILEAATGFGKTAVGASFISSRRVNTLIIVHRKQLMNQWKEQLSTFLDIKPEAIGFIGGGKKTHQGIIDIAMIQSLQKENMLKSLPKYGQIIVDECHHFSAFTFENILKKFDSSYVYGLTATPKRRDGLEKIMSMQLGPIRYKVKAKDMAKIRPFKHILIPRYTDFKGDETEKSSITHKLYNQLINDKTRNTMIFNDVLKELDLGAAPIIITERTEHVELLANRFEGFTKNLFVLTGKLTDGEKEKRLKELSELSDDSERLVIATGKYIGEGFDHPRLDTLFLTFPISWRGTLKQYVGRLHRLHEKKTLVKVYDYLDNQEPSLEKMYYNRLKGYKALGYVVQEKGNEGITEQMNLF